MKKKIIIIFFVISNSCNQISKDNIISSFRDFEYNYVYKKSLDGDSHNVIKFLKINNIYDAKGYDHGENLVSLIEILGDSTFCAYVNRLKKEDLNNLNNYIGVTENIGSNPIKISSKFPLTYKALNKF